MEICCRLLHQHQHYHHHHSSFNAHEVDTIFSHLLVYKGERLRLEDIKLTMRMRRLSHFSSTILTKTLTFTSNHDSLLLTRHFITTTTMASSPSPRSPLLTPTYDNALHLLSLLQSNKTIINLFAAAADDTAGDINASALPEMRAWLARAGHTPADLARLRCLHVAGTKGKGSVSALTAAVLRRYPDAAGRVGLYTSPHLASPRERICLGGDGGDDDVGSPPSITRDAFARYFFELWNALSDAARREGPGVAASAGGDPLGVDGPSTKPFYFRFLTLLAFHAFLREGITSAVIECGIGGEYDSTNVLPPEAVTVSVVTQLGIDHVGMLGDTVEKIAWHKAGIFKPGVPAYTYQAGRSADDSDSVMRVLRERAAEKGTSLSVLTDADVAAWAGVSSPRMEGAFQKGNMALATVAARQHLLALGHEFDAAPTFQNDGAPLPRGLAGAPPAFAAGLRAARLRGRCETVVPPGDDGRVRWYLDGAHTEDSLVQVARWFAGKVAGGEEEKAEDSIRVLVFNQQDRDAAALLRVLLDALQAAAPAPEGMVFDYAFFPTNDMHPAAADGDEKDKPDMSVQRKNCDVVRQFCPSTVVTPVDSVSGALDMSRKVVQGPSKSKDGVKVHVLVTGSFNLVGPALRLLEPDIEL